jgi:hypothetical protein
MDFFNLFIKKQYPDVKIKFKKESFFRRILGNTHNTVSCSKNTIWFPSRIFLSDNELLVNELLAHEYVHLVQMRRNPLHKLLGSIPESIAIIFLVLAVIYIHSSFSIFLGTIGIVLLLPIYPVYRIQHEFEAYKMTILVRMTQWNNKFPLPKSHYNLFHISDAMIRDIIDNVLFSKTYNSQWCPAWVRSIYFEKMKTWRNTCILKYFRTRLAFEQKNSYIRESDMYSQVLSFFIENQVYSYE